jgi:hypothetical protein
VLGHFITPEGFAFGVYFTSKTYLSRVLLPVPRHILPLDIRYFFCLCQAQPVALFIFSNSKCFVLVFAITQLNLEENFFFRVPEEDTDSFETKEISQVLVAYSDKISI